MLNRSAPSRPWAVSLPPCCRLKMSAAEVPVKESLPLVPVTVVIAQSPVELPHDGRTIQAEMRCFRCVASHLFRNQGLQVVCIEKLRALGQSVASNETI